MTLHLDKVTPRLPQRSPPAFGVEGQPSCLTPADARSPVNAPRYHYAVACNLNEREGTSMMTTHQGSLHKIDGFILRPLTHLSTYACQWFVAEVGDP